MKKTRYPSKEELIKALQAKDELKGYKKLTLLTEHKKLSNQLAVIRGEVLQGTELIGRGQMTCSPVREPEGFDWEQLRAGESYFVAYSLEYKGETLFSMIGEGLKKSIKSGRIPFVSK
jgi:hypothetical protein